MHLIAGLKDRVLPSPFPVPSPVIGDITGRSEQDLRGSQGDKVSVESRVKRLAGNLHPLTRLMSVVCEATPRSWEDHSQVSNSDWEAFLFSSDFAASSSSFLWLWIPWFDSWLIIDITDDFVFAFHLHLTF